MLNEMSMKRAAEGTKQKGSLRSPVGKVKIVYGGLVKTQIKGIGKILYEFIVGVEITSSLISGEALE